MINLVDYRLLQGIFAEISTVHAGVVYFYEGSGGEEVAFRVAKYQK